MEAGGAAAASCSEGFGVGGQAAGKRKKELCARLQQMERPLGFARGGPQLEWKATKQLQSRAGKAEVVDCGEGSEGYTEVLKGEA